MSEELKKYKCKYCDEEFGIHQHLANHVQYEHDLEDYKCKYCGEEFKLSSFLANHIQYIHMEIKKMKCEICGMVVKNSGYKSHLKSHDNDIECDNCGVIFNKTKSQQKKSKSGKHFCSSSCSATYNNKHKKTGTRRSKLEEWLEFQLIKLYPDLEIIFNSKEQINLELDIYIPSMKIAIEINGIFNYKPIYGIEKLNKIKQYDKERDVLCENYNINLHTIDTSDQKQFTPESSERYLKEIQNIIMPR